MNFESIFERYKNSTHLQPVVENIIPLASQTFSKSRTQYPLGVSPLFVTHSKGSRTWDIDGNEYIDLVSSLAAVTLGYSDPDVNQAVIKQLELGVTLSLPTELEYEVASLIVSLVPSAEKVRFAKNGSDATSAAIRLARAYTAKDHILFCGYHGWHDWYIGNTSMGGGVPLDVSKLSHSFEVNNFEHLERLFENLKDQVAAVVIEPMSIVSPTIEFLTYLRSKCLTEESILIFDETVTGFRVAPGGAQEFLGINPDLTTLGKGIANGFPLSAICGRADIMDYMSKIFVSGTFGGELLSLAAAKVVLEKVKQGLVTENLKKIGEKLNIEITNLLKNIEFKGLKLVGHPSWKFLLWDKNFFTDLNKTKTLFLQEMFKNGVLILNSHNVTLAHSESDIKFISSAYAKSLSILHEAESSGDYEKFLAVEPIKPLFTIR